MPKKVNNNSELILENLNILDPYNNDNKAYDPVEKLIFSGRKMEIKYPIWFWSENEYIYGICDEIKVSGCDEIGPYVLLGQTKGKYIVFIKYIFLFSEEQFDLLEEYFHIEFAEYYSEQEAKAAEVYSIFSELMETPDIKKMIFNFSKKLKSNFFLVPEYFAQLEGYLYSTTDEMYGEHILLLTSEKQMCQSFTSRMEKTGAIWFESENLDSVIEIVSKDFDKVRKIINGYSGFICDSQERNVIFILLRHAIMQQVIDKWSLKYDELFGQIIIDDENEKYFLFIQKYCELDGIVPTDPLTMGEFTLYLQSKNLFPECLNYVEKFNVVNLIVTGIMEKIDTENFKHKLMNSDDDEEIFTINDIDLMDGFEFENFVAKLFMRMGYAAEVTQATSDQGIDVIATKKGISYGIQAKCYSQPVGNSAVQQAVAGKTHYGCNKAMVITNNRFTSSAIKLAETNSVILWDRDILKEKIGELF